MSDQSTLHTLIKYNYFGQRFFRSPNNQLVYVSMLKCASCYYENMFVANQWNKITYDQINWDQDCVFGFIMEPGRRHIKGMVQDLMFLKTNFKLDLDALNLPDAFWQLAPTLGVHSLGYHQVFGKQTTKINWIPLDLPNHRTLVDDFFVKNQTTWNWNFKVFDHKSEPEQLALFEKIYKSFDGPGRHWFNITYHEDVLLYKDVLSKFAKTVDL